MSVGRYIGLTRPRLLGAGEVEFYAADGQVIAMDGRLHVVTANPVAPCGPYGPPKVCHCEPQHRCDTRGCAAERAERGRR